MGESTAFQVYGQPLETVTYFTYLGRLLTVMENDWPEFIVNLKEARRSWYHLSGILGREGDNLKISVRFYQAIVQDILIFGLEMWVVTP